ncbi:ATP-binding cassette domain-containing protein [Ectobacillus funiculus]
MLRQEKPILCMEGITKIFPGVKALSDVNFTLRQGEVHALMGENGAGKSTLIKVLTGVHNLDGGTILFNGKNIEPKSPLDAQNIGISTVYQEVNLCPNLTVAENIFIGRQPKKRGSIDWKLMNRNHRKFFSELI